MSLNLTLDPCVVSSKCRKVSNWAHCINRRNTYECGGGDTDKLVSNKYYKVSDWAQCINRPNICNCGGGYRYIGVKKINKLFNWVQCINRPNTCECGGGMDKLVSNK